MNTQETRWSPPQATTKNHVKPLKPLTTKQKAFVHHLIENPKESATAAARATYKTTTDNSASQIATENLRKPQIINELAKYLSKAEYNLMILADKSTEYAMLGGRDGAAYASVATSVNNSILDRLLGKATTRIESQSTSVTINVDLTGATGE